MFKILLMSIVLCNSAWGTIEYDAKVKAIYRSFPSAVATEVAGGAALPLWKARGIFYGYIRPSVAFQTSVVTNRLRVQFDIFPISFFGFFVGMDWNKRDYEKFSGFTCSEVNCSGQIRRSFIGHKMALAYGNYFLLSKWRIDRVEMTDRSGTFADVEASLLARSRYDQRLSGQMLLGYKLDAKQSFGILHLYNSMKYLRNHAQMWMGFHRYQKNSWSLLSSGGVMSTRDHKTVGSILLVLQWNLKKGLPLF